MTTFLKNLKTALTSQPSLKFIDDKNALEPALREQDASRATVTWCSSVKGVESHQIKTAEKMCGHGWQVWGVVKRHEVLQPALVLRSVDKKCWSLLFHGGSDVRQYTRSNTPAIARNVDWGKAGPVKAADKNTQVSMIDRIEEQWPSHVGAVHVWDKPDYAKK